METQPTIRLERTTKRFALGRDGGFTAIEDVSLEVRLVEFVSVVGPSGCGKSTLLGMISGLLAPSAGRILVEGEEVAGINNKLGYLFQRDALFPWKTILDNVAVPLLFRGWAVREARMRARAWIQRVGLAGFEGLSFDRSSDREGHPRSFRWPLRVHWPTHPSGSHRAAARDDSEGGERPGQNQPVDGSESRREVGRCDASRPGG